MLTQVAQAQHLKDHVRLVERHIDEIDVEKSQAVTDNARRKSINANLGQKLRENEMTALLQNNEVVSYPKVIATHKEERLEIEKHMAEGEQTSNR